MDGQQYGGEPRCHVGHSPHSGDRKLMMLKQVCEAARLKHEASIVMLTQQNNAQSFQDCDFI